ncbi:MAG TPA: DinB family protein [Candidatus Saccharimonadales bacterium]|nr:DinB family protein [Candidatus Saccharimonadales bacterium]
MPLPATTLDKLARAQASLLGAANAIPPALWSARPKEACWSGAEVLAHVITVERVVVAAAKRIFRKPPKHIPMLKRFRLPFAFVEKRMLRLKTPIPIDPQLLGAKDAMLAELGEVRGYTLALIGETGDRDLSTYRWQHPFLGSLNAYEWFWLLGSHQIRHEKQMREIAAALHKSSLPSSGN